MADAERAAKPPQSGGFHEALSQRTYPDCTVISANSGELIHVCDCRRFALLEEHSFDRKECHEISASLPSVSGSCTAEASASVGIIAAVAVGMRTNTILVVEDHPDCRELLRIVLSRSGYVIVEAATGKEALERVHAGRFDLILLDFGLPGIAGDTILRQLKTDPATEEIPVIVTTGYMTAEVEKRAVTAGAAAVLIKPYELDRLMDAMAQCLSFEVNRQSPRQSAAAKNSLIAK